MGYFHYDATRVHDTCQNYYVHVKVIEQGHLNQLNQRCLGYRVHKLSAKILRLLWPSLWTLTYCESIDNLLFGVPLLFS